MTRCSSLSEIDIYSHGEPWEQGQGKDVRWLRPPPLLTGSVSFGSYVISLSVDCYSWSYIGSENSFTVCMIVDAHYNSITLYLCCDKIFLVLLIIETSNHFHIHSDDLSRVSRLILVLCSVRMLLLMRI